jgi:translation initiation factor 1 (eIF-1/SUI1)
MVYNVEAFYGAKIWEKEFESPNKKELLKDLKKKYAVGCTFKINRKE